MYLYIQAQFHMPYNYKHIAKKVVRQHFKNKFLFYDLFRLKSGVISYLNQLQTMYLFTLN